MTSLQQNTISISIALLFICMGMHPKFATASASSSRDSQSEYLLVITSQRSAEVIAEAARIFKHQHPDLNIQARTDSQLSEYTNEEIKTLFHSAIGIFATGLYGPNVAKLSPFFRNSVTNQLIINSDHRLVKLSQVNRALVFENEELIKQLAKSSPETDSETGVADFITNYPQQTPWIITRTYWQAGGVKNSANMIGYLFQQLANAKITVDPPKSIAAVRWFYNNAYNDHFPEVGNHPILAVIDHAGGARPADTQVLSELCDRANASIEHECVAAVANWGSAGIEAISALQAVASKLSAIVMLQDFVVGGGEGRERATDLFKQLNVPIIKGIKLRDRSYEQYLLSSDGLPQDKVYYQVAMPELQGASQPQIIATAGAITRDSLTGIRLQPIVAHSHGMDSVLKRSQRWHQLQHKANRDKRVAIIYYNHPPGRHNIGADNLDVPASLWHILNELKNAGYHTGELPKSQQDLLDLLQEKGVNLPRDAKALETMADSTTTMTATDYQSWFGTLPKTIQDEMQQGPFGLLHQQLSLILATLKHEDISRTEPSSKRNTLQLGLDLIEHSLEEMHHLLEGLDHKGRDRADKLIAQLETCYVSALKARSNQCMDEALSIIDALRRTGIEGLGGWGPAPGRVMVVDDQILLPGIQFGHVFVGPQPPRGWEINEELLHANLAFPPPHQYLAFYHYLQDTFQADALLHLGRHSTYEFLPRRSVGVGVDDYSHVIAGDIPGIYPYIVDGVGEGIQAKRRGLAVMVDHLTPPLKSTPLYDELLQLRQLVESFESHHGSNNHAITDRLVSQIRDKIRSLNLTDELAESMSAELAVMGIHFDEVDDDMLVHEIGHYLTTLQERFMPLGLHIYGKGWRKEAISMMVESMSPETTTQKQQWQALLKDSPDAEITGLIAGLNGEYIAPGQGNDPIRSPNSLPTGRNFYALDSSLIPSKTAWEIGKSMAEQARQNNSQDQNKREAVILWASDVVRDEGVMIAFGLDMLGLKPEWNSRGLVTGLSLQTLAHQRVRRDTLFTTSGLFRDLYGQQMQLLNRATLLALDASSQVIIRDYPALTVALTEALAPLKNLAKGGSESLQQNQVASHWIKQARLLMQQGFDANQAGTMASYRVFTVKIILK